MTDDHLVNLLRQMLWIGTLLSTPVLLAALLVGLVVGLVQAITSIQEQTLAFVPKLAAIILVFVLLGSWMTRTLVDYTYDVFSRLPEWAAL